MCSARFCSGRGVWRAHIHARARDADTPSAGEVAEAPEPDMAGDDAEPTDADADAADAPDMASADAESTDDDAAAAGDPEWPVCVSGEKEEFGMVTGDQPDGITVYADGRCVVSEWAGGFDGYFSTEAGAPLHGNTSPLFSGVPPRWLARPAPSRIPRGCVLRARRHRAGCDKMSEIERKV